MTDQAKMKAAGLSCWTGPVKPEPLGGGITNTNFTVLDNDKKFVVRIGEDIPVHGIMRFNELGASQAAYAAGISPAVVHAEPGAMVLQFVEGKTLEASDIRKPEIQDRIIPLLKRIHHQIPHYLNGPSLVFWVFQVIRSYSQTLKRDESRMVSELPRLEKIAKELEDAVGPIQLVFGHNDLLAANFIDDHQRIWILDWDYAGFNSPVFDLANLASNNEFDVDMEHRLLELYFESKPDRALWHSYSSMKCASLLRETMWSMVSEIHSPLDFDFKHYTIEYLDRFNKVYETIKKIE
jgi:thiamine kinase-like enzyme